MMEAVGFTACFIFAAGLLAAFVWTFFTTIQNENGINKLWDENKKLKDYIFDLENKPIRKTK